MRQLRSWPGRWRPVWVAVAVTGRPEQTIRTWYKTKKLAGRKDDKTGELLVDLVQAAHLNETTRRRIRRLKARADQNDTAPSTGADQPA